MSIGRNDKLKLFLLLAFLLGIYSPIIPEMVTEWLNHSDNSHGFIVPLMSGYFLWQRKDKLSSLNPESSLIGGLLLLLSLLIYLISYAGGIAFTSRIAFVLSLLALLWCCLGTAVIRTLLFPVLFLLFMIPVPYSLLTIVSMPLQLIATKISANIIQACSIPVYREGNMLFFVGTQLEVAEACSGIRSIVSLAMLAIAFASMTTSGWKGKMVLVLSAIPVAIIANIFRVSGTGILAHFYGDKIARGFLHEFSGIVVFIFGFLVLMGISALLNRGAKQ